MSTNLARVTLSLLALSSVGVLSGCEFRTMTSTRSSISWGNGYGRYIRPINGGYNPYDPYNPSYAPYRPRNPGYPFPGVSPIHPIGTRYLTPNFAAVSTGTLDATAITTTIGNDIDKGTPEAIAIVHSMSVGSATTLKSAMEVSLSGDRGRLIGLGFDDSEVEEFMVRSDASGASPESYARVAGRLNMPSEELKSFVSNLLSTVSDSKWEIYAREYPEQ